MQKLLTIVVPVYKVEQYINKCLDSCIIYKADGTLDEEKMNQLEVIIVNDGTPDRSAELSREYTVRYPQTFRQIDQENRGHGGAWNHGLQEATGKYLRFLDSDDWLTNLDKLMDKLAETDADLVFTPMDEYHVETDSFVHISVEGVTERVQDIATFSYKTNAITVSNFHCCTYKTVILQSHCPLFEEHVPYDDMILFVAPILVANNYIIYEFPVYQYLVGRPGQTMNPSVLRKNGEYLFNVFSRSCRFTQKHVNSKAKEIWANYILQKYVGLMLLNVLHLYSYHEALKKANSIKQTINIECEDPSKQYKRFVKWPFIIYWLYENLRSLKNK